MSNPGNPAEVPATVVEAVQPVAPTPVPEVTPTPVPEVTHTAVVEAPVAPAVVEAPVVPADAGKQAPVVEPAPAAPVEAPAPAQEATILADPLAVDPNTTIPDAPVEPVPVEPVAPTVEGQSAEPAPPPKYEAFVMPEGATLDEAKVKEFTDILSEVELKGKADHAVSQEVGQKLVDFHVKEVQRILQNRDSQQVTNWEAQKTAWKNAVISDPEIGGARLQTSVDSALNFLRTHGGTQEEQAEFRKLMDTSGLGNHPMMVRLFAKAGKAMSEGRPLAAVKPVSPPKSKTETMYGKR